MSNSEETYSHSFFLDENAMIEIAGTPSGVVFPRWMQLVHYEDKRTALILIPGESLFLPNIQIEKDTNLYIRYAAGLPNISADGLVCEISFVETDNFTSVGSLAISGGMQPIYWRSLALDISFLAGRPGFLRIQCTPGPENDPTGDWLAIADLCIGLDEDIPLLRARSFHELRSRNEIEHFSSVYRHAMYTKASESSGTGNASKVRELSLGTFHSAWQLHDSITNNPEPLTGESTYQYAARLLAQHIPQSPPDFVECLQAKAANSNTVKVLSLCSGSARIEANMASQCPANVEWSLLDINTDLLNLAAKQFPPDLKLDLIEADVNQLCFSGEKWDVILCVSGLHHIVELEKLIQFCHTSLTEDGEFWSIGEYVGKNGNRLWPPAKHEANKLFQQLPEKYRLNRHTQQNDIEVPDGDCSVGFFEGIRSEDIEPIISRWFEARTLYRKNCFLWRLTDSAYSDNYNLSDPVDRAWLIQLINAEIIHFQTGGRGTELFAIYRPRTLYKGDKENAKEENSRAAKPGLQPFLTLQPIPTVFAGHDSVTGRCLVCGKSSRFFYQDKALWRESLSCEHCRTTSRYRSIARGILQAITALTGIEASSLSELPSSCKGVTLQIYDTQPPFYYEPCAYPLPDILKARSWIQVMLSQYKPNKPMGATLARGISNQNLECLTFADASLDIIITSDVMEHVRLDNLAHQEIYRVLKPGGIYIFTVPHCRDWDETLIRVQVTDPADPSQDRYILEPEYHGDTNSDSGTGVLSYRAYGRDLDDYLTNLGFTVEYWRENEATLGILNTELYYCRKKI